MRVRGLALDVDGTITLGRGTYLLDLELASALRRLEAAGVRVMLVTGNALPVVAGVARYLGFSGPHVAENGCLVFDPASERIVSVCGYGCREEAEAVTERLAGILKPSWQNGFRLHDYAFRVVGSDPRDAVRRVNEVLEELGGRCTASYSGYAVHVRPRGASKGVGLARALEMAGLDPGEVVAVGDAATDAEMAEAGVRLYAVGNADPELKARAERVLPGESSSSVLRLVEELLGSTHA